MLTIRFRCARAGVGLSLVLGVSLWTSQAAAQVRTPTHVACVGDSITYGYMASSASASYPSVLQNLFGSSVKVMNYGHNGATMLSTGDLPYQTVTEYTAATTFVSGAGATAVVDVIIMLGTNDSKSYRRRRRLQRKWLFVQRRRSPSAGQRWSAARRAGRARLPTAPAPRRTGEVTCLSDPAWFPTLCRP